jgi:DNA-binding NtrC family response regulator
MGDRLPRVLIVDDLFGRHLPNGSNEDRDNLCAAFMLRDVTADFLSGKPRVSRQKIKSPVAEAVFIRGQTPDCPAENEEVQNDLAGSLEVVRKGWVGSGPTFKRWSLVLLDLCFYTGRVTGKLSSEVAGAGSNRAEQGMPEGCAEDISPSQFFGLKLLRAIHDEFPDLPIVILSSQDRDKVSKDYSAHGALGFLPRTSSDGDEQLRTFLDRHGLQPEPHGLIVGQSLPLLKALRAVRRTAYNDSRDNILIRGERGVGKEEFSRYIHRVHPTRASKDLIAVNSAVLTSGLYASELFGIEKRKATGVDKHEGAVARAHQGDLFFDEVKDMIPEAQAALLRFLEEGTFTPTGATDERQVDVRVVSATNADLDQYAASSRFREDLLDRLRRGGTIFLPPLRDRKDDIPLLAMAFLRKAEQSLSSSSVVGKLKPLTRQFSDEALSLLMADDWPGNIRVLRDVITKVVKDNDVEFVFPAQIEKARHDLGLDRSPLAVPAVTQRPIADPATSSEVAVEPPQVFSTSATVKQPKTLAELIATMRDFEFDLSDPDALYNQLDTLDEAAAKLVVGYLLTSLRMNKDHATGEPEITKAMQFVTGKNRLTTSSSYDAIIRLMKRHSGVLEAAMQEPLLKKAYEQARTNRPTNRKQKSTSADE